MACLQQSWLSSLNKISTSTCKHSNNLTKHLVPLHAASNDDPSPDSLESLAQSSDPVKLAFEKAKAYRESANQKIEQNPDNKDKSNKGVDAGSKQGSRGDFQSLRVEKADKKQKLSVSSIDFIGLNFADKKTGRGLPAGLVPVEEFSDSDVSEVEIIVGDTSNFGETTSTSSKPQSVPDGDSDLYKPKVSTWGVFPRPGNISKRFGGGKVINPGDVLETAEDRAAKEERTRQLLAAYKKKVGLSIDQKLKAECEKVLKDGNFLMDSGQLKAALPLYENVMNKLPFKSELHGLAALQWSICQDSLNRQKEAQVMYEKLQSHPNAKVSKRAREFSFSFKAMEMMKFTSSTSSSRTTGYQNYFEAFVEDKTNYSQQDTELDGALNQTLPYVLFLISPIVMVFLIALQKSNIN